MICLGKSLLMFSPVQYFIFRFLTFFLFCEQTERISGCKLQTKPKAKWTQSSMSLQWQIRKIEPRSKIYLNAIFTMPPEVDVDSAFFAKLKRKPAVLVQFYLEEGSGSRQAEGHTHGGTVVPTGTSIEISPAKRSITNLRTVNKRRLFCRYSLSYSS